MVLAVPSELPPVAWLYQFMDCPAGSALKLTTPPVFILLAEVATTLVGAAGAGDSVMLILPVLALAPQPSVTWQL